LVSWLARASGSILKKRPIAAGDTLSISSQRRRHDGVVGGAADGADVGKRRVQAEVVLRPTVLRPVDPLNRLSNPGVRDIRGFLRL